MVTCTSAHGPGRARPTALPRQVNALRRRGRRPRTRRLLALALLATAAMLPTLYRALAQPAQPEEVEEVVVAAGDTLWDIASVRTMPGSDVREMVLRIRQINGLADTTIHPGQVLRVPKEGL